MKPMTEKQIVAAVHARLWRDAGKTASARIDARHKLKRSQLPGKISALTSCPINSRFTL